MKTVRVRKFNKYWKATKENSVKFGKAKLMFEAYFENRYIWDIYTGEVYTLQEDVNSVPFSKLMIMREVFLKKVEL